MVAKLSHANPMTVLRTIVHQLEYDILEYVVIGWLVQGGREKLKDDALNLSYWLQYLASFWGHLPVSSPPASDPAPVVNATSAFLS
uniref:THO complex subunitTHOC2 N-terminal domain-containing protein n=1 Tax=Lactuca sativa TaxID=4236 RepID=A0A9R1VZZ7_LACSA|nr:hypothetical protein LSAT_V11C400204770 [Lactuca sativa]